MLCLQAFLSNDVPVVILVKQMIISENAEGIQATLELDFTVYG